MLPTIGVDRPDAVPRTVQPAAVDALKASMILAVGSSLSGHLLFIAGLPLTFAGFFVASRAAARIGRCDARVSLWPACWGLSVVAAVGIVSPSTHGSAWYEVARRLYAALGVVLVGLFATGRGGALHAARPTVCANGADTQWPRLAVRLAIVFAVLLHAVTPTGTSNPEIDVFTWTQTAAKALLHGIHPYTVVAPDVFGGRYDPGYTLSVYPYMPATLLAYAPAVYTLDDFRFVLAACLPITIALLYGIGRRLAVDPEVTGAAALTLALHPAGPRAVASGWTEPLLVAVAAAFVYLAVRNRRGVGQSMAFFLLPALKQYVCAPAVLYVAHLRRQGASLRAGIVGAVVAAATVLPFLIWNWRATLAGVVFQIQAPTVPRPGSTSIVALMATAWGVYPAKWVSVATQMVVAAAAWVRVRDSGLAGLLLASALCLYATFLVGWQAFVNYYYFVGALLALTAVVAAAEPAG